MVDPVTFIVIGRPMKVLRPLATNNWSFLCTTQPKLSPHTQIYIDFLLSGIEKTSSKNEIFCTVFTVVFLPHPPFCYISICSTLYNFFVPGIAYSGTNLVMFFPKTFGEAVGRSLTHTATFGKYYILESGTVSLWRWSGSLGLWHQWWIVGFGFV